MTSAAKRAEKYREWAAQNEAHYRDLRERCPTANDWALTVLFYAAVHEANAFLAARGQPIPRDHGAMKSVLSRNPAWRPLEQQYEMFQGQSNSCRYKLWMPSDQDVVLAEFQLGSMRDEISKLNAADGI